jgi:hypothetical protein
MIRTGRRRILSVKNTAVGQWSGNGLGYFNATIFKAIGYESSSTQLLLNLEITPGRGETTLTKSADDKNRATTHLVGEEHGGQCRSS